MTDQPELPGMPEETPIVQAGKRYIAQKTTISEAKLKLVELEKDILSQMESSGIPRFKMTAGGENYEFELVESERSIRCAKITKTVRPNPTDLKPAEATIAEPLQV